MESSPLMVLRCYVQPCNDVCLVLVSLACHGALATRYSDEKRPVRIVRENRDHRDHREHREHRDSVRDSRRDQSRRESQMSIAVTKREEPPKHVKFIQGGVQTSFPYQFVNPLVPPTFPYSAGPPQYSNTLPAYTPHLNAPYDAYSAPLKAGTSPAPAIVKYEFLPKPAAQTAPGPAYSQQSFSQGHYTPSYPQPILPTPAPAMLLVMAPPHPGNPYGALMLIPTQNHQGVFPQQPITLIPVPTAVPSTAQFRGPVPVAYPTVPHPNLIPVSFKPIFAQRQPYQLPQAFPQNFAQNYAQKSMNQNSGAQSEETQMPDTQSSMEMTNGHSQRETSSKDQTFGNKVPNFRPISVPSS